MQAEALKAEKATYSCEDELLVLPKWEGSDIFNLVSLRNNAVWGVLVPIADCIQRQ